MTILQDFCKIFEVPDFIVPFRSSTLLGVRNLCECLSEASYQINPRWAIKCLFMG